MVIYIGADHKGFQLKGYLKQTLQNLGYEVADVGDLQLDETDNYPEFAAAVAKKVSEGHETTRGVLICGSGVGVSVVANKFPNVRASLVASPDQAFDSRNDDDANILCLGANYLNPESAKKILITWFQTPFSGEERFINRLKQTALIEESIFHKETEVQGRPTIS